ncbi:MAG TPA: hypothetical protein VIR98_02445 [Candidatus Paceibacterota bacterium]|jgi:hypothetical protein
MAHFSWRAPEYPWKPKSRDWYWAVGIISAAAVVTTVILGNALFGGVIALSAFSLALFTTRKPKTVSVELADKGIVVDKTMYLFASLQTFSIDESRPNDTRLLFKSKKAVMPLIVIPLDHPDTDGVRAFLSKHLPEEAFETGFAQALFERLGF